MNRITDLKNPAGTAPNGVACGSGWGDLDCVKAGSRQHRNDNANLHGWMVVLAAMRLLSHRPGGGCRSAIWLRLGWQRHVRTSRC
jgi:hypothetical protein